MASKKRPTRRTNRPTIQPIGEDMVLIQFAQQIDLSTNAQVRAVAAAIEHEADTGKLQGISEVIPAYCSVLVYYDPDVVGESQVVEQLSTIAKRKGKRTQQASRLFRIPTAYTPKHGPDLDEVAQQAGMSRKQLIEQFSETQFPVYCLGFLCGLPYMGGVAKAMQLPRLDTPRTSIPAGSVGIANEQALVMPVALPSGWRYIGRTFVKLFDPSRDEPIAIQPGDRVQCIAVTASEARKWNNRFVGECVVEGA